MSTFNFALYNYDCRWRLIVVPAIDKLAGTLFNGIITVVIS